MISLLLHVSLFVGLGEPRCDIGVGFSGPTPETALVLAIATGDAVRIPVPEDPEFESIPASVVDVVGYQFVIIAIAGGPGHLQQGDTLVAVPWEYDAACDPLVWTHDEWVPSGAEVVFYHRASRAVDSQEHVIDVLGWHSPYPYGELLRNEGIPRAPADRNEWLSAGEFYAMVSSIPPADPTRTRLQRLAEIENAILGGNPRWSTTFPGTEILRRARSWANR